MAKNKKKISPENNWGGIMGELRTFKEIEKFPPDQLFEKWSLADLRPLLDDPFGEAKYLRHLSSKNPKKRKKAQKTAEQFRIAMRDAFYYIFDDMTDEKVEELIAFCESSANGMLSSLIAGADKNLQLNVTVRGRKYYVERLLGASD
jgi:hypothetical protein